MYDLIVIGGGPAGSAAGRQAGKMGLDSLLIEKENFPRYKACGGALSEHAMSYLDFIVPGFILEKEVYGARVHYKGQIIEESKENRIATLVTRSVLDNYLLEKAREKGIEVRMGEKVLDCKEEKNYVEVITDENIFKGKYVVIAEGAQGKLKNLVRKKVGMKEMGVCLVTEIETENDFVDNYINRLIDIHFGVASMGYGWIFPHEGYFSVGVGGFASGFSRPKKTMEKFLKDNKFEGLYQLKGHLIPVGGIERTITTPRIVLCGDAAGFVDSFCGEGMAYAIRSGQIAVEVISKILNSGAEELKKYEEQCKNEFGNNLKYSLGFTKLMHYYPNWFLKILTQNAEVLNKYLEIPARGISYKELIMWLLPRVPKYKIKGLFSNIPADHKLNREKVS